MYIFHYRYLLAAFKAWMLIRIGMYLFSVKQFNQHIESYIVWAMFHLEADPAGSGDSLICVIVGLCKCLV